MAKRDSSAAVLDAPRTTQQMVEERKALLASAEKIIGRLAVDELVDADERAILLSIGLSGERLASEIKRVRQVNAWRGKAGSASDRAASQQMAEAAASKLATERVRIDEAIRQLQAELSGLEAAARQTDATSRLHLRAAEALRDPQLLPEHARSEYQELRRLYQAHYGQGIAQLAAELRASDELAKIDPTSRDGCRQILLIAPNARRAGCNAPTVDLSAWQAHLASRREADVAKRDELDALRRDGEELRADVDRLLGYYAD